MAESAQANAALVEATRLRGELVSLFDRANAVSKEIITTKELIDAIVSKFGVRVRWAGPNDTRLDIMGPDGNWQIGVDFTVLVEGLAGRTYIDQQITKIIDDAPESRNTLGKLSRVLDNVTADYATGGIPFRFDKASSEWMIRHDLNRYPVVITVDTSGNLFEADVQYLGPNIVAVRLISPQAGVAYIS